MTYSVAHNHRTQESQASDVLLLKLLEDTNFFLESLVSIRTEDGGVKPLILNPTQQDFSRRMTGRDMILKPRRRGFSTYILGKALHQTITREGFVARIICHVPETRDELFDHLKIMFNSIPEWFRPKTGYDNRQELSFPDLNSRISISTAGDSTEKAEALGRGGTIHYLHCSEFAFWPLPQLAMTAVKECVPLPHNGGTIVIETTANGHNYFWQMWRDARAGKNIFKPHFYSWLDGERYKIPLIPGEAEVLLDERHPDRLNPEEIMLMTTYGVSLEQIKWRRVKLAEGEPRKFPQEYPLNETECFLMSGRPFFNVEIVNLQLEDKISRKKPILRWEDGTAVPRGWRVYVPPQKGHSYVAGVDCAEGLEHSDNDSITILDRATGEEVCYIWGVFGTDVVTRHIIHAHQVYGGNVLWGIEDAKHGQTVLSNLLTYEKFPKKSIYHYTDWDQLKRRTFLKPGWNTNPKSRPMMLDELDVAHQKGHITLHDFDQLSEFLTFVVGKDGTPKAQKNTNDDGVISAAIALQMLKHRPYRARGFDR